MVRLRSALAAAIVLTSVAACGRGTEPTEQVTETPTPGIAFTFGPVGSPTASASVVPSATPLPTARPRSKGSVTATELPTAPPPTIDLAKAKIKLKQIVALDQPTAMAVRKGDGNFYFNEKGGRVVMVRSGSVKGTVLDISGEVSTGGEQGLLGLAFSPDGKKLYVNFTNTDGDTRVREYAFSNGKAVVSSARDVLQVDQPYANHNGGNLVFGPDGYLYIGLGDGGAGGDPQNRAQNLDELLGKLLRIDPEPSGGNPYTIPDDNPFVGKAGRDEIWAYGLRNPWRYTFDRLTGDLYMGDVGQDHWEEVDYQPASAKGGDNYGWNLREGTHQYGGPAPANHHAPMYEYSHEDGNCSVTGGYVYRAGAIPNLQGAYVFGDFCAGRLRAFVADDGKAKDSRFLGPKISSLSSFGQDLSGNLYVMSLGGKVYRIDKG